MNAYEEIKKIVLPNLRHFKNDLLKHDKKALRNYKGRFIHSHRESGTNLLLLDISDFCPEKNLREQLDNSLLFLFNNNHTFLYRNGEIIKEVTKPEVEAIAETFWKEELLSYQEKIKQLNIPLIAMDIYYFINREGKLWKSKLKKRWENGEVSAELQRLRNHFDFKVLSLIKNDMEEKDISSLLFSNLK